MSVNTHSKQNEYHLHITISRTIKSISQYKYISKKIIILNIITFLEIDSDLMLAFCANIARIKAINTFSN